MGKYFYIVNADTTKSRTEWEQQNFIKVRCLTDIAGHLTRTAQNNKTDIKDMRLYIADSKRHWEAMASMHYDVCRAAEIEREKTPLGGIYQNKNILQTLNLKRYDKFRL